MKTIKQNLSEYFFILACVCGANFNAFASQTAADTTGGCTAVASFSMSANNKTITLTNSSFGLNNATTYWSFGDGNWSVQQNPVHTYANNGTYNVCLSYYDNTDSTCYDMICKQVTISGGSACNAAFTFPKDSSGCSTSLCVSFTNQSTPANGFYSWSFGDGGSSNQKNPTHCYAQKGNYQVLLVVTDSICTDSLYMQICVNSPTSIKENKQDILNLGCYPNPFSSSTTISYTLAQRADVHLSVCDVLGREVTVLENRTIEPGKHETVFDGSGLSKGIYFVKLSASDGTLLSKKMILAE